MSSDAAPQEKKSGLSSSKREDIWALIIACIVLLLSLVAPEGVHDVFKKALYFI